MRSFGCDDSASLVRGLPASRQKPSRHLQGAVHAVVALFFPVCDNGVFVGLWLWSRRCQNMIVIVA